MTWLVYMYTYTYLLYINCVKVKVAQSCPTLWDWLSKFCPTLWILQARILGHSRRERLPFPSPGDLPNPGIKTRSPTLQADSLPAESQGKPKNTGVCSVSLLQWIFLTPGVEPGSPAWQVGSLPTELSEKPQIESHPFTSNSLQPHGLYSPWNSPGQNTGVGSISLLQGIFPTQGLNPGLLHCRWILYQLSHEGSA